MTEPTVIDRSTPTTKLPKSARMARPQRATAAEPVAAKAATVSASALAAHLDVSRRYVEGLADIDGVLRREADGSFLLDQNRVAYCDFCGARGRPRRSPRRIANFRKQKPN